MSSVNIIILPKLYIYYWTERLRAQSMKLTSSYRDGANII